ncbi:MAG: hypothetical protein GMKNLPBB_03160 [Myxococcota bacterium]|nr:hypothetical protein [Myxococcota bacterium]
MQKSFKLLEKPAILWMADLNAPSALYADGFSPAVMEAGALPLLHQPDFSQTGGLHRSLAACRSAAVVTVDLSAGGGALPWLAGFCQGADLYLVLSAANPEQIPADLRELPHVVHGGDPAKLREGVKSLLAQIIHHLRERVGEGPGNITVYVHRKPVREDPIQASYLKEMQTLYLPLELHNPGRTRAETLFEAYLYTPAAIEQVYCEDYKTEENEFGQLERSESELADFGWRYKIRMSYELYPMAWDTMTLRLDLKREDLLRMSSKNVPLRLLLLTSLGPLEYPFEVKPKVESGKKQRE